MFPKEIFSIRAFRNLWIGQAISRFGDALYYLGFLFMVKKITGRDDMVGFVGAAETLPYLLFSAYAGTLADRLDRKKIMLWSDIVSSIVLLAFAGIIAINGKPPLWSLFVAPFLLSSARAFFMPAKNASIPRVVPADKVLAANSVSMMTDQVIWLCSMAVSGGVLAGLYALAPSGFYLSFVLLNMLSFVGSTYYIFLLPAIIPENDKEPEGAIAEIKAGWRYAVTDRVIQLTLIAQIGISLFISPFFVVFIATNDQWFDGSPSTLAWIECAFVLGLFLTSMYVASIKIKRPGMAFGVSLGITGVTVAMMAFSKSVWLFVLWNLQLAVPDEFRGRVMSIKNLIMMGVQPVGMMLGGTVVKVLGIPAAYLMMGIGFALSGAAPLIDAKFRSIRMPEPKPDQEPVAA
jgi:MFS family permease